ncbi:RNA polymerase sigma factor SigX [Bacillus cytotoxicus]|uniref:RNA polymerase, sigma-24 subunit, ECF subfamily n=1 Tax=Bacillus cytotoxicus (strain DSM 22905 / CIP 110041 / 391-98 / NVH 391-98) TaxID=315749 RepID=A7GVG5_BACCN|nr:RNA polymerase sigma factor SigX [Bacillus cytotoxicus]ABS24123.1 RNA polymerase, sigma-24 subunit, ECF subfamily [Bacillus cytotoxicus NVH 391-98]AWC34747.1 RNA polymerase subunit sigma [Bacillus cytotoxicus]AWC38742.1 RNA polymerase subunit sigma [Bacillus cytotoxicus]AWC46720.1 RNA polymerase subunit sigma [Bacillus cytotoxicus]AWC62960.1 RNA polymerase subunit sigma [Bacillus cytotoxicus]
MLTIEKKESHASDMTFEDIFKQYYVYAVKQILWIVKNQPIAEELAQEVFLQLYHSDWKAIENIPGWLIKSSTYAAYNHLRSEKRHQAKINKEIQYHDVQNVSSLDDDWIRKEEITKVQMILNKMNDRERTLLLMKFSGFQYKEIAAILQIEISSIGTLLVRAKMKFRKIYKQMEEA